MTVEDRLFSQGTRMAVVYKLNQTTGRIDVTGTTPTTPYSGDVFYGPKAWSGNFPTPRVITHVGQDRPLQIDFLPALEGMTGELTVSAKESNIIANITGTTVETIGTSKLAPVFSSKQGFEPVVGLWLTKSATTTSGLQRWVSYVMSAAKCYWTPSAFTDGGAEEKFSTVPNISTRKLWGPSWNDSDNGATSAQLGVLDSTGYPYMIGWLSDSSSVAYNFNTDELGLDSNCVQGVWRNDSLVADSDYAVTTTGITFEAALEPDETVTCFYLGTAKVRE